MLYQEYKQRLENYLNIFGNLWRFRYLILLILALVITLIGVLLGITGNVSRVKCPETIEYGAEYELKGHAVFRQATVQYRAENATEWTEDRPVFVGTYEVRAVSRGISGNRKVGGTSLFRIVPKPAEVLVAEETFLYGESPSATVALAYRDDFEGESFEYAWQDADTCTVTPHVERILNEQGDDVTGCYSLVSVPREVSVLPRPVTISTDGATKVYDGKPLLAEERYDITEGSVVQGERLEVSFPSSLVSVGECENMPVCTVYSADGKDVTEHYAFTFHTGTLKMLPRPITILTNGATKVYDGEPLVAEQYEITEGSVAKGERLDVSFPVSPVWAGECANMPVCAVHSADGRDVTENYDVTLQAGTLKILPRPITVKTGSKTWIHDGEPHSCLDGVNEVAGLVEGHSVEVRDPVELTEITDTEDEVRYRDNVITVGIRDADGQDVTKNYEIAYEYGKLRIKTEILFTVYAVQKIYDGTPLKFEDGDFYAVKPPDVSVWLDLTGLQLTDAGYLPLSSVFDAPVSVTDPGTGLDVKSENRWRFLGDADEPILTVERRKLEITSKSVLAVRDNTVLDGREGEADPWWISFGTLAKGHTIEVEVTGTLSPSSPSAENTISSVKILNEFSVDVTQNYEIELRPGILEWIS